MTHVPLVSIVIPVFNGANYLRYAIESALAQTYAHIEVLVINDGSTDGGSTERIARAYGDRLRYIEKPNGGVATALNEGLDQMRGDYFSWLSHDDVYYPTKVERQVAVLTGRERSTVVYSNFDVIDFSGRIIRSVTHRPVPESMFRPALIHVSDAHGCSLLIHRSHFDRVGRFDPHLRYTQDYDMWFRMGRDTRFVCMPDRLIQSRTHADAGSTRHDTRLEEYWLYKRAIEDLTPAELTFAGDPAATYITLAVGLAATPQRCTAAAVAYDKYKSTLRHRLRHLPMEMRYHGYRIRNLARCAIASRDRIRHGDYDS